MSDVKEVEFVVETALVPTSNLSSMVKEQDRPIFGMMEQLDNLDWSKMRPNHAALLLMQKPFPVRGGGQMFLNLRQALWFAVRCFELGLSPFSDEVFFDASKYSVGITLAGKKALARNKGIDLGPPLLEELSRDWKDVPRMTSAGEEAKKLGFQRDIGCKCTMRVGDPKHSEHVVYTAWLSEWLVGSSMVWKEKPTHMLATRATEKAISLVLGTGASSLPDEKELE